MSDSLVEQHSDVCPPDQAVPRLVRVAARSDLTEDEPVVVRAAGLELLLVLQDGQVWCIRNTCSHMSLPLDAIVDRGVVICSWHGARFCLWTGEVLTLPARHSIRAHRVVVDGDDVLVEILGEPSTAERKSKQ